MAALTPDAPSGPYVSVHGRRFGFMGDGISNGGNFLLWLGNKIVGSTRLPLVTTFTGAAAAGAITLTGANVGDLVISAINLTTPADASASFESTISVANQIQQSSASNLSGSTFLVSLSRQS
jgi:hypothetical protein